MRSAVMRPAVLGAAVLGAWIVFGWWIAPEILERLFDGRLPGGDSLLAGRDSIPLADYLARLASLRASATFVLLTTAVIALSAYLLRGLGAAGHGTDSTNASPPPLRWAVPALALAAGGGEVYYQVAKIYGLGEIVPSFRSFSHHSVWMAPLALLIAFGLVAVVAAALTHRAAPEVRFRVVVGALVFLGSLAWAMQSERLAAWAGVLLAAGSTRVVTPRLASAMYGGRAATRRVALAGGAILLAVAAAAFAGPIAGERAGLRDAGPVDATSVLLIVLDTQRAASTSLYATPRRTTPGLEQWARRGVVFSRAFATSSWTLPSHATMFTGRFNHELRTDEFRGLGDRFPTLAEELGRRGYLAAGFVANHGFASDFYGLGRGFHRYDDQPVSLGMIAESSWLTRTAVRWLLERLGVARGAHVRRSATEIRETFIDWIQRRGDRPFFAFLNFIDAHDPYAPPSPFDVRFGDPIALRTYQELGHDASDYSSAQLEALQAAYEGSIAYLDSELDRLLAQLEERGILERTLVIITADHGEAFGENGHLGHRGSVFQEEIRVPLLILRPGPGSAGVRISRPVSLRDVPATVADVLGFAGPFPGRSLLGSGIDTVLSELHNPWPSPGARYLGWWSLVAGDLQLVLEPSGRSRLFELTDDPLDAREVTEERLEELARMREALVRRVPGYLVAHSAAGQGRSPP